ncbi:MAG: undecaprenyldiphospho-muramoylpentapeptide beta-N-acetylglucosaminyltransferase [Rhizobiaceae bacterium]|nr:undecaprenyldiphospho-muramoylpentapeptide beta-N-acetylglucosaminyltransferase [Rhizobiaceae bacterium]
MSKGNVLLCAGGTGGHLFPAEAVAHEMITRGYTVHLAADDRVRKFADRFPAEKIHEIKSATLGSKNPIALIKTFAALFKGYRQSQAMLQEIRPVVAAGFGGYPTVPPIFAASRTGVPTLVHEANAVLGRANRMLGNYVNKVAIGFGEAANVGGKITVTGNPVRPDIITASGKSYPERNAEEPFNLLVFGGSQGAAFFSECLPEACKLLDRETASRLRIVQQARPEDKDAVIATYKELGIESEVDTFFSNMHEHLADAHLVVSRAGASTVSELAVMGRPSILVPYPHALDHDQANNAAAVSAEGGATLYQQAVLTPQIMADELTSAVSDPKKLALAAKNAKKTGKPDAARVLADMLEELASSK